MKLLITFIEILSSILTIISATGLWGIPEKFQAIGIQTSQLQIAFALSLILTICSFIFARQIKSPNISQNKKTQIQFGGSRNNQNMG